MSDHNNESGVLSAGTGQKTLKSYLTGFILCVILTLAAFWVVGKSLLDPMWSYIVVAVLAILQLFVQVVCFLRLNGGEKSRWNLMSFLFTVLIIVVIIGGSLWIMWNLNYNMMSH